MIGKRYELWQFEYVKDAYEDQLGVKHEANVIRRKVIVTIVKTQETRSAYTGDVYPDGIWIAKDENGATFVQHFDELSMGGRQSWSDGKSAWIVAQSRGWFLPYMNPDGTKAVPQVLDATP